MKIERHYALASGQYQYEDTCYYHGKETKNKADLTSLGEECWKETSLCCHRESQIYFFHAIEHTYFTYSRFVKDQRVWSALCLHFCNGFIFLQYWHHHNPITHVHSFPLAMYHFK